MSEMYERICGTLRDARGFGIFYYFMLNRKCPSVADARQASRCSPRGFTVLAQSLFLLCKMQLQILAHKTANK